MCLLHKYFIDPFDHISATFFIQFRRKEYNSAVAFFICSKLQNSRASIFRFGTILGAGTDVTKISAFRTFRCDKML